MWVLYNYLAFSDEHVCGIQPRNQKFNSIEQLWLWVNKRSIKKNTPELNMYVTDPSVSKGMQNLGLGTF